MIWALAAWRKFHSVVPLGTDSIQYTKIYINLQKWYTKKSNNLDPIVEIKEISNGRRN